MNARDARQKAIGTNNYVADDELAVIRQRINVAVKKGNFHISYEGSIHFQSTSDALNDEGYFISSGNCRNESYVTISW